LVLDFPQRGRQRLVTDETLTGLLLDW
jgi:hypothetical protein